MVGQAAKGDPGFREVRTMKLEGVSVFVAVVETGSISGAARSLRLSKSVVSERLTELERALGTHLVQRSTRRLSLTEDGIVFHERAKRITSETAQATEELAERRGELAGPLRIAGPRSFGDLHLGPALYTFLGRYPDILLSAEFDDRFADVGSGYDALVRIAPSEPSKLETQQLTRSRRVLVGSPQYLDRFGRPRSLAELDQHRAVHFMERSPDDWTFTRGGQTIVCRVAPRLRVNSCRALRDASIAGLGLAYVPTFLVHEQLESGSLEALDVGADPDINSVYIAYHNGLRPSAKLVVLINHLKEAFGDPPYWDRQLGLGEARR
jgi:DNA-binding transcriptional LysR family regulator